MQEIKKKDKMYYARILPSVYVYDVCDLTIRTVCDDWFVGIDKHDKHAYMFSKNDIDKNIFFNRDEALKKVREAEKNKKISYEIYYEEY